MMLLALFQIREEENQSLEGDSRKEHGEDHPLRDLNVDGGK